MLKTSELKRCDGRYFADVFDLVEPGFALLSLITFAATVLAGCRNAACAADNRAIGTRNGLQLT